MAPSKSTSNPWSRRRSPSDLAELYRRHINDHVFVRGDRNLDFQAVAQIIDLARGAGWDRVGLMTR